MFNYFYSKILTKNYILYDFMKVIEVQTIFEPYFQVILK